MLESTASIFSQALNKQMMAQHPKVCTPAAMLQEAGHSQRSKLEVPAAQYSTVMCHMPLEDCASRLYHLGLAAYVYKNNLFLHGVIAQEHVQRLYLHATPNSSKTSCKPSNPACA